MDELNRLGLPTTCVVHNIETIKKAMEETLLSEKELKVEVAGKRKNSVVLNYKLSCLYFERKMFGVCLKYLVRCKELASILLELEKNKQAACLAALSSREFDAQIIKSSRKVPCIVDEPPMFDYETLDHAQRRLDGIEDDIAHVKDLQTIFCTTTGEAKILPCLGSRFSSDRADCAEWWTTIRTSPNLLWHKRC